MPNYSVPIVFLVFNRPGHTARIFAEIRKLRPRYLTIVADGPRPQVPADVAKCAEVRRLLAEQADWPCELRQDYSDANLGCKIRVSSGITAAFSHYERAIILEDDCLPHPDFFPYCETVLERHAADAAVMHVSGYQPLPIPADYPSSYYFAHTPLIWGWATWRRAWQHYDLTMPHLSAALLRDRLPIRRSARAKLLRTAQRVASGRINTWDYQWLYSILYHRGLCATPRVNLVSNVGFDAEATHTTQAGGPHAAKAATSLGFPLQFPARLQIDQALSCRWLEQEYRKIPFYQKWWRSLRRCFGRTVAEP